MNSVFRTILFSLVTIMIHSALGKDIESYQPILEAITDAVNANTEDERQQYLNALSNSAGSHYEKLIPQLLIYEREAKDIKHGMAAGLVVSRLQIPLPDIVCAIAPFLDTTNIVQRDQVRNWLMAMDEGAADSRPNYDNYELLLKRNSAHENKALILYMYDRDPQVAVVSMAQVYGPEGADSEIAVKSQSDAKKSVDYFAERPEWWAHLYVASFLEQDPLLRTPELMEILEKDTHPIVQEKVSKLIEEMEPKPAVVHPFQH